MRVVRIVAGMRALGAFPKAEIPRFCLICNCCIWNNEFEHEFRYEVTDVMLINQSDQQTMLTRTSRQTEHTGTNNTLD